MLKELTELKEQLELERDKTPEMPAPSLASTQANKTLTEQIAAINELSFTVSTTIETEELAAKLAVASSTEDKTRIGTDLVSNLKALRNYQSNQEIVFGDENSPKKDLKKKKEARDEWVKLGKQTSTLQKDLNLPFVKKKEPLKAQPEPETEEEKKNKNRMARARGEVVDDVGDDW